MDTPRLTDRQRRILAAIEAGHTTLRDICRAADISSTSVAKDNLEKLALGGHVVLRRGARGLEVAAGRDFCAAWDAAARLAGNPDA